MTGIDKDIYHNIQEYQGAPCRFYINSKGGIAISLAMYRKMNLRSHQQLTVIRYNYQPYLTVREKSSEFKIKFCFNKGDGKLVRSIKSSSIKAARELEVDISSRYEIGEPITINGRELFQMIKSKEDSRNSPIRAKHIKKMLDEESQYDYPGRVKTNYIKRLESEYKELTQKPYQYARPI
jgi:hypothetical protein